MKKKIIIPIIVCLIIIIGITGFIIWNNRTVSTITMDINPSIEINLNGNDRVNSVEALNNEAKDIISDDLNGKTIDEAFNIISNKVIEKGYTNNIEDLGIIVYTKGNINNNEVASKIQNEFDKNKVHTEVIIVEEITEEDESLAKNYNVSPAKMAYIKSINDNDVEKLIDKSVSELREIKISGNYCDDGYIQKGDKCYKEITRVDAKKGPVCPQDYFEYEGKCYRETRTIESDQFSCREGFELVDNDCVNTETHKALKECKKGELDRDKCVERTIIGEAYEFCRDPGRTLYEHKCLATKPTINGGCLNGDMYYKGKCVNTRNDYYMAEWKCPNGFVKSNADGSLLDNDTHCYEEKSNTDFIYKCDNDGYTLINDECTITYKEPPRREFVCPNGTTKIDVDRCLNQNDTIEKVNDYYCEDKDNRLDGTKCIVYEIIEAKSY
jgi:hypothetical protein